MPAASPALNAGRTSGPKISPLRPAADARMAWTVAASWLDKGCLVITLGSLYGNHCQSEITYYKHNSYFENNETLLIAVSCRK